MKVIWLVTLAMTFAFIGCTQNDANAPFARSAAPAKLALTVRVPATLPPPRLPSNRHAVVTPIPLTAQTLALEVGEVGAAELIKAGPFLLTAPPGQPQDFQVGEIPPGLNTRVAFFAFDPSGVLVASGTFRLDFLPGQVTSNDVDLGVGGSSDFVDTSPTTAPIPTPAPTATPPPPAAGIVFVAESADNDVVRIDTTNGSRVVVAQLPPSAMPYGVAREPGGTLLVTSPTLGKLFRVDLTQAPPSNISTVVMNLSMPMGVGVDQGSGEICVLERGTGSLDRFNPNGTAIAGYPVNVTSPGDLSGADYQFPGSGTVLFAEQSSDKLFFDAGGTSLLFDFSTVNAGLRAPEFIAADPNGDCAVSEQGNAAFGPVLSLLHFSGTPPAAGGTTRQILFSGYTMPNRPRGIVTEALNSFLVAETGPDAIVRITPNGRTLLAPFGAAHGFAGMSR